MGEEGLRAEMGAMQERKELEVLARRGEGESQVGNP